MVKSLHPQCRGPGFDIGQGTRPHMRQLRPGVAKKKYRELIQGFKNKKHCGKQVTDSRTATITVAK